MMEGVQPYTDEFVEIFTAFFNEYSNDEFYGIMPDTGAGGVSSGGLGQYKALLSLLPDLKMDSLPSGKVNIRFGTNVHQTIGTVNVPTPFGTILFHILPIQTPFLLCLQDMNNLKVEYRNLSQVMAKASGETVAQVKVHHGHPWIQLDCMHSPNTTTTFFTDDFDAYESEISVARDKEMPRLNEQDLRRLHRRLGHPSASKLTNLLKSANYDVSNEIIKRLSKFCHFCQMNERAPSRFRFTIRDDFDFNHQIFVDVCYLNVPNWQKSNKHSENNEQTVPEVPSKPVLHIVDSATSFQAARFLPDMSAKSTWNALREAWIDTYIGPPDIVTHDAGTNFASNEFRASAGTLSINVEEVPVESHHSIGKIERYHGPLKRAFAIIDAELKDMATAEQKLQMSIKAINDTMGPNGYVPTLLVFGAYPKLTEESPPAAGIRQRAHAINKGRAEVRKFYATRQIRDAINMRNGPNTSDVHQLPIISNVRVFREKTRKWDGPFRLLKIQDETATLEMDNGPTDFRTTSVRPYYISENADDQVNIPERRKANPRGRPALPPRERLRRAAKDNHTTVRPSPDVLNEQQNSQSRNVKSTTVSAHFSQKEKDDMALCLQLRKNGVIVTSGAPFEASDKVEIDSLSANGVFAFVNRRDIPPNKKLFRSRMVREIKGKDSKPYEKSRLVIQGFNDKEKETLLTQAPTIQRASQRLLIAIAPSLIRLGYQLVLRDITQAYVQSETNLSRDVFAELPKELRQKYPHSTVMHVVKPLYGIAEAGNHWFSTYSQHHKVSLNMETSTWDPCLMLSRKSEDWPNEGLPAAPFAITAMQTDDTLFLCNQAFSELEQTKLKYRAKDKTVLGDEQQVAFNGCILARKANKITMQPKGQIEKLTTANDKKSYIEQRARGAYVATVCQPEASFDYAIAAQSVVEPQKENFLKLNKRIEWQINNPQRGITFVPLDLAICSLYVFVDGSLANNDDFSSQIGYTIVLGTEQTVSDHESRIYGNIVH